MSHENLEGSPEQREAQHKLAVGFAKNYLLFVHDARGRDLLEHWRKTLVRKRTPVRAEIQEYARDAALREFVQQIDDQITLAESGGWLA